MCNKKKKILAWVLMILWMIFIFYMSNQPADISNEQSDTVLNLLKSSGLNISDRYVDIVITIIRKGAHFTEYLILSLLYFNVLRFYISKKKSLIYSVILVFFYASTDEFHQIFIEGRAGRFTDVLIDTSGGTVGSLIVLMFNKIKNRRLRNK